MSYKSQLGELVQLRQIKPRCWVPGLHDGHSWRSIAGFTYPTQAAALDSLGFLAQSFGWREIEKVDGADIHS